MIAKYPSFTVSSLLAAVVMCAGSACAVVPAQAPAPTCFSDANAYMVATFGDNYRDDENLKLTEKTYGTTKFSLAEDATSGTNHARVLLRELQPKKVCVVLSTPPVAQLDVSKVNTSGVPEEFTATDQAPPGLPENEITYRITPQMNYVAAACSTVTHKGKVATKKMIKCAAPQ
jgi:hypothetical protein